MSSSYFPCVVGVAVLRAYVLRPLFDDGTAGDVDFSMEQWTGVLEPPSGPAYFAQVRLDPEAGTITRPDGLDIAPEPLYEHARAPSLTAV
ncbi:MAG: DUF2442 domain-containing protein [Acidimicrobiales bacterium]